MKNNVLLRILLILLIYLGLRFFGGAYGQMILYPITLLVTFLHEFGHALGAILTGGEVLSIEINSDGSGMTTSRGGSRAITLMGGYIGSAILGNVLFFIGAKNGLWAKIGLNVLAALMVVIGFIWFGGLFTTGLLMVFALTLFFIANKTIFDREVLMFLGLACLFHIVQDFRVGPGSDLEMYAEIFIFIPKTIWMYIWLGIVVILCLFNVRLVLRSALNERNRTA
jgi:Peptidase M50B-like